MKHHIFSLFFLLLFFQSEAQTRWRVNISNIEVSPNHAAHLTYGEEVYVTFDYYTDYPNGVRIFIRPMSGNAASLGYAAHPSILYQKGYGSGKGDFTIKSGDEQVDGIRFEVITNEGRTIHKQIIPAVIRFSDNPLSFVSQESESFPVKRTILPNGAVEIRYSDGKVVEIYPDKVITTLPNGAQQISIYSTEVQDDTLPPLPSDSSMRLWLEKMNGDLLSTIRQIVDLDETAVNHYLSKESLETHNVFEQIQLRMQCIDFLSKTSN